MENRETEKKTLNQQEMEQASGGFEYTGCLEWLNGHNIACPSCGNENKATLERRYTTGLHAYFTCRDCGQKFYYTVGKGKKVIAVKEK